MKRGFLVLLIASFVCLTMTDSALARKKTHSKAKTKAKVTSVAHHSAKKITQVAPASLTEARLIEVYQLVSQAQSREALSKAESLVRDYPNFQLAQLVYGDLLASQFRPLLNLGDIPAPIPQAAAPVLGELRDESLLRLKALRERPPTGAIPSQFLTLSARNKHAIAIDASRSRLYLFENRSNGLTLVADYYVSIGKSGLEKTTEGDSRTPLGVYFITSNLDPRSLKDFYGSGALPISYPNELDSKRGKTGRGIWLHGTPPGQFSRAPLATDGCIVLANPDLDHVIQSVEVGTTPVVISQRLEWVMPRTVRSEGKPFEDALTAWQGAKSQGNMDQVLSFYSPDFNSNGKTLSQWTPTLRDELNKVRGRAVELKDLSLLRWTDQSDTMVVTFGEVAVGTRSGPTKRQYWARQGNQWKIFYEGVI